MNRFLRGAVFGAVIGLGTLMGAKLVFAEGLHPNTCEEVKVAMLYEMEIENGMYVKVTAKWEFDDMEDMAETIPDILEMVDNPIIRFEATCYDPHNSVD